jgi:hypothetical protein
MQARSKSALILGSTLLIGALIGALLLGWFMRDRMRHIPHPRHFSRVMERMIRPQDDAQREVVRAVLKRYQQRLQVIDVQHREALKAHMDSLLVELQPLLSVEQLRRMERRHRRFGELMGPWRERRERERE